MSKTLANEITSYLKRRKTPANTTQLVTTISNRTEYSENAIRRSLYAMKSKNQVSNSTSVFVKGSNRLQSTWQLPTETA